MLLMQCVVTGSAQSNAVYSLPGRSGPPIGYQIATIRYSILWEVGVSPCRVRVLSGDYWTDSAGQGIPWAASRPRRPGDTQHRLTRIVLGPVSFSLPIRPAAAGLIAVRVLILVVLTTTTYLARQSASGEKR